jgi:hypothetical protein
MLIAAILQLSNLIMELQDVCVLKYVNLTHALTPYFHRAPPTPRILQLPCQILVDEQGDLRHSCTTSNYDGPTAHHTILLGVIK